MLKKAVILFVVCFLFVSTFAYSQETKFQQFQTFSWAAVQNVRKYEINIEKLQDDQTWTVETSQTTPTNNIEMLLYPGKYRVSVSAFNVLNKKASQSEWVNFIILDETEPFIFANTFASEKNAIGSLFTKPALTPEQIEQQKIEIATIESEQKEATDTLANSEINALATETIEIATIEQEQNAATDDLANSKIDSLTTDPTETDPTEIVTIQPEQNADAIANSLIAKKQEKLYPQNSFRILGKNIFFSETEFFLVPVNPDSSQPDAVTSYTVNRPEVKLEVLSRNIVNNEVVVSYDETQLFTGLYKLVVNNSSTLTTSINVNVYTSRICQIEEEQYNYNERYKVPALELVRSNDTSFVIKGKDFSSDVDYSLVPAEGIPYPYSSIGKRVSVPLNVNNYSELDNNEKSTTLSFSFNPSIIETGYYLFLLTMEKEEKLQNCY